MDPWSKGKYSRQIREALMVVEKLPEVNPPSGRVPGQVRQAVPILESPRGRNRGRYHKKGSVPRVCGTKSKHRPKGGARGGPPHPGGHMARPGGWIRPLGAWETG